MTAPVLERDPLPADFPPRQLPFYCQIDGCGEYVLIPANTPISRYDALLTGEGWALLYDRLACPRCVDANCWFEVFAPEGE